MDELSKIRNVKVAPAIGYIPYPSYPDLPPVGVQDGKLATGGGRKGNMTTRDEIEEEQTARRIAAEERFKIYRDLLLNKSDHDVPYYYIFYSLSSIILSVGLTSIITFIPVHNMFNCRSVFKCIYVFVTNKQTNILVFLQIIQP